MPRQPGEPPLFSAGPPPAHASNVSPDEGIAQGPQILGLRRLSPPRGAGWEPVALSGGSAELR
jgi:hypothetical protein